MRGRLRLLLPLLPVLAAAAPAHASPASDQLAYGQVAAAYSQAGGHLDPCAFTQAQLAAALRGIPAALRSAVPDLRTAIRAGIAAHERGGCKGRRPLEEAATGGAAAGGGNGAKAPAVTTPPVTTTPAQTAPAVTTPTTVQPAPTTTAPAPVAPAQPAASGTRQRDRRPLLIGLIALGALVLAVLLLWSLARVRGWEPPWAARMRHGWGEAGFRATSTWAEFTDWLRLGR